MPATSLGPLAEWRGDRAALPGICSLCIPSVSTEKQEVPGHKYLFFPINSLPPSLQEVQKCKPLQQR